MEAKKAGAVVVAGSVLMLALTGCVAGISAPAPTSSTGASAAIPGSFASPVPNDPAQRKNVQLTSCQKSAGSWVASGVANNAGTQPVTYKVTVTFTTTQATDVDQNSTTVTVQAGGSANWQVSGGQGAAQKTLRCVLRGVATS